MSKRFQVKIDCDLKELIPSYLDNKRKEIKQIEEALQVSDFETTQRIGHTIKGNGGSYGLPEISTLGRKIEEASKEKNVESIEEAKSDLGYYIEHIDIEFVEVGED